MVNSVERSRYRNIDWNETNLPIKTRNVCVYRLSHLQYAIRSVRLFVCILYFCTHTNIHPGYELDCHPNIKTKTMWCIVNFLFFSSLLWVCAQPKHHYVHTNWIHTNCYAVLECRIRMRKFSSNQFLKLERKTYPPYTF